MTDHYELNAISRRIEESIEHHYSIVKILNLLQSGTLDHIYNTDNIFEENKNTYDFLKESNKNTGAWLDNKNLIKDLVQLANKQSIINTRLIYLLLKVEGVLDQLETFMESKQKYMLKEKANLSSVEIESELKKIRLSINLSIEYQKFWVFLSQFIEPTVLQNNSIYRRNDSATEYPYIVKKEEFLKRNNIENKSQPRLRVVALYCIYSGISVRIDNLETVRKKLSHIIGSNTKATKLPQLYAEYASSDRNSDRGERKNKNHQRNLKEVIELLGNDNLIEPQRKAINELANFEKKFLL
ncbi:hypothetical protein [Robiginitalea sp. IMCC43444]|uniref:hypothetical protein n=1 Tax=Robiginitalea sp. IMCC43444 TaxID=3459121 RepID=UPI00404264A0